MSKSRREFLLRSTAILASATAVAEQPEPSESNAAKSQQAPAGTPPAFGTTPEFGPKVSSATFAAAEKLVQVELTEGERAMAAASWRTSMASLYERRVGPRKVKLSAALAPASTWNPVLPGHGPLPQQDRFVRSTRDPGPVPSSDDSIAFAPLWKLSRWVEIRKISSERLHADLPGAHQKIRSTTTLYHHPDARTRAQAGHTGGSRDRRGALSGPAPWNSLGRQRPARHGFDSHHLRGGALQKQGTQRGRRRRTPPTRSGRGTHREAQSRCAGAE